MQGTNEYIQSTVYREQCTEYSVQCASIEYLLYREMPHKNPVIRG